MAGIRFKKPVYPIPDELHAYLSRYNREMDVPISYSDLMRFENSFGLSGANGEDTLWETLIYSESDRSYIFDSLRKVYAQLKSGGDVSSLSHLIVDRVDYCLYANTHPFRVRIVNKINDLFDYFYVKQADASRIYGMELEHLLSPNKIQFLVKDNTLIEEHIQGIPGEAFIRNYINNNKTNFNPLRLAKEFVKFNERSLVQLLGDMRRDNFVVEIVPDFDDVHFRLRSIDFDQECYEGNLKIYMPQFFKENNPIIQLGLQAMSPILELQYQKEERSRLALRYKAELNRIEDLLRIMSQDTISKPENVIRLKEDLARLYEDDEFLYCHSMGEIVSTSLHMLFRYPVRRRISAGITEQANV
ncbi:MAG TPA: hypothetical protein VFW11_12995 [Cyclobacteriaceae bacterium]|nr:hypothetical protein [Cyclobacteriaceae bacterium]